MEIQQLHRGRLIDHIQLVVRDIAASEAFYTAVFKALEIPLSGRGDDYFWADELFVSTASSAAACGQLTGRHHPHRPVESAGGTTSPRRCHCIGRARKCQRLATSSAGPA